jgi:hypothetical protein
MVEQKCTIWAPRWPQLSVGLLSHLEHISLRLNRRDSQWFVNERVYPP